MTYRRNRWATLFWLMLLVGIIILLWAVLIPLWEAAASVRADLAALESLAERGLGDLDTQQAVVLLHRTRADLEVLQTTAQPLLGLAPYMGWLPRYGADIRAAPELLGTAVDLATAVDEVAAPLAPLLETGSLGSSGAEPLQELGANLTGIRPQLLDAQAAILQAQLTLESIDTQDLSPRTQDWLGRLDKYLPWLEQGVNGALLLPELLGWNGPRTYLVLVQNEDELRATGGFISGVALMTVDGRSIGAISFEDSYAIDDFSYQYPDPPTPLRDYMLADQWVFRDSNWSPDFPTTAQTAIDLYTVSRETSIDGVIGMDQQAIVRFVEALGPLELEGYAEPVTGQNVIQMARQAWAPGDDPSVDWWVHRKDFMAALLEEAVQQVRGELGREELLRLARSVFTALREKDLLLYLQDQEAAALVDQLNWNGAVADSSGDFLMVVDTNMGFNKVNALVEESLNYVVDLTDPSAPRAILNVQHDHPSEATGAPCDQQARYGPTYEQMMHRCYWDYLRVLVPSGASLVSATPHPVPGAELLSGLDVPAAVTLDPPVRDRSVLATLLLLRPGENLETIFEYFLPSQVLLSEGDRYGYHLLVQKQPGTRDVPLRVHVLLPAGADVLSTSPSPLQSAEIGLVFRLFLETDQTIAVAFQLPE